MQQFQRNNGATAIAIRKELPHKKLAIRTSGSAEGLPDRERKKNIGSIYFSLRHHVMEEKIKRFAESAFTTYITDGRF